MDVRKQRYPVGQQDFQAIRNEGKVYVDKTGQIYDLIDRYKYVFLARPRRFGKSLLLSTLRYYFEGRKELFEGLKITELTDNWERHPVIHLSLAMYNPGDERSLNSVLNEQISHYERIYEIEPSDLEYAQRFSQIIKKAYKITGKGVTILIDEYDNPLINSIENLDLFKKNRGLLRALYTNLKDNDEFIRFGMLTGVSRFSEMTVFSGINNLSDITFENSFTSICGFTEKELKHYLLPGIEELALEEGISLEQAFEALKEEYDGYHFSENLTDIYNPFSLLKALNSKAIKSYWFATATPSFIIERLKNPAINFSQIFQSEADEISLGESDHTFNDPVALLFQTGYLTIKGYDKATRLYSLGIPNKEVRTALFSSLLAKLSDTDKAKNLKEIYNMRAALTEGKPEEFLSRLQAFFAPISYRFFSNSPEAYFQNNLYLILHSLGLDVKSEYETSNGRIDILVTTDKYIYVIELKLNKSAAIAYRQIERLSNKF